MLKVGLLCGVIVTMSATGLKANLSKKEFESKPIDAQFILELEDDIDTISADKAIKQQNAVFQKVKNSINRNATQDKNFTILNNAVVISANKEDIADLKNIPGVKYVTENATHIVEKSQGSFISLDNQRKSRSGEIEENASAETMNKPEGTNEGEGTLIAVLDNEFYLRGAHVDEETGENVAAYKHETFTALPSGTNVRVEYTDVKEGSNFINTHARGYANKMPGGYQKTPGKEGSLFFNSKVPFYFDYAGDSYNGGSSGATPDCNVESTIDLHGSHVSSIAAGNAPTYKGIAPKAQLALMKVFTDIHKTEASDSAGMGQYGRFNEVSFIEALEDCITIGVDAINVSIGSDLSDFEEGTISQRTLQKISDHGILSAISAGNAGKASYSFTGGYANWTRDLTETGIMGSFANNASTMTVASGQPEKTFYADAIEINGTTVPYDNQIVNRDGQKADYDNEHRLVELINGEGGIGTSDPEDEHYEPTPEQEEIEIPYTYVRGFGEEKDYKDLEVSHRIVVVNRGKINFSTKFENAEAHGAAGLIIINNDPTAVDFTFRCDFGDSAKSIGFPIVVALYKDKPVFEANPEGTFKIRRNKLTQNEFARSVSDFSTDGSTYNLDLKPEITTPGSNIKGAVWPQNKIEKKTPYSAYEYFNGTSMAAPNYEGAMALVLSKVAKEGSLLDIAEARKSIDMKMMSTATPMLDVEANDEDGKKTVTSPRMQGAGMVNLEGAYNTEVYLEGGDSRTGELTNKAKINLRNNDDIAKGKVKLSFVAHNEGSSAKTYKVSYSVLRPALALSNKVLTKDYGTPVEVDSVKNIPGFSYYSPEAEAIVEAEGTANYKDVIKVSKDINYYRNAEEYNDGEGEPLGVFPEGMYYCSSQPGEKIVWSEVPKSEFQSIRDVEIANVDCGTITVNPGDNTFNLDEYELTAAQKDKIQELYENGTYIEGFISLKAQGDYPNLSMPYMGYYSLADRIDGHSYDDAPVVEPFSFEKDPTKFYGSDLVNDVAKSLVGKDNADMGSMMLAGYAKNIEDINTERVLTNDDNFARLKGFYPVATAPDPYSTDLMENPKENIYAGNPLKTNTLIIQQFVYRSVKDNFFTITNKVTGEEVYRSALEDCLFGDTNGKYTLYKSHVEGGYLGAGYVAHRAWALVPLYNVFTKQPFATGEYELKFNYQLAATDKWVSKAYTLHLDSDTPVIKSIAEFTSESGAEMVRVTYKDTRCAYAIIGSSKVDVKYDEASGLYYSEVEKSVFDAASSLTQKTSLSEGRVFMKVVDFARGETTAICHFEGNYSNYTLAQGTEFTINHDFKYENGQVSFIVVDENGNESEFTPKYGVKISTGSLESAGSESGKKKGFFAKIADFFKKIGDFFKNLFKKK